MLTHLASVSTFSTRPGTFQSIWWIGWRCFGLLELLECWLTLFRLLILACTWWCPITRCISDVGSVCNFQGMPPPQECVSCIGSLSECWLPPPHPILTCWAPAKPGSPSGPSGQWSSLKNLLAEGFLGKQGCSKEADRIVCLQWLFPQVLVSTCHNFTK